MSENFSQWPQIKEYLEQVYGKDAFVSKAWLRKELLKSVSPCVTRSTPVERAPVPAATPTPVPGCDSLESVRHELGDCTRCKLHEKRKNIVFGEGSPTAELMFIGEGPGEQEDVQGRPFVGKAGQLLDKIIEAMGFKREQVYIGNVVKCRPPSNRTPEPDEVSQCQPFLFRQIEVIRPKVIVALGGTALKCLFGENAKITRMRGTFIEFHGCKLMPTFHPAFLLRNPDAKKEVWEDMKKVKTELGLS